MPEPDQPVLPQEISSAAEYSNGLSKPSSTMLISHYRGHANGLEGQSIQHLQLLLKFYEDQAQDNTGRGVKREHDDDVCVTGERKRRRPETIVLDD
ncbi:hypothetical protein E8E11_011615 [Didymella keratinophila]|nr:hypothetical protein E8E11_011615 [Didymella keratinophila]